MPCEKKGPEPGYLQIRRFVYAQIAAAKPGEEYVPLTTERALCELFRMSRGTIRRSLRILTDEGLLVRRPRYGTFINPSYMRSGPHKPMIGIVVGKGEQTYWDSLIQMFLAGFFESVSGENYLVHLIQLLGDPVRQMEVELRGKLSGLVWLWIPGKLNELARMIDESGIPHLFAMPMYPVASGESLTLDFENYGFELMKRLIRAGRSDVLFLENNREAEDSSKKKGVLRACSEAGIDFPSNHFMTFLPDRDDESILRERLLQGGFGIVNASGLSENFIKYFPETRFIIPGMNVKNFSGDGLPTPVLPIVELGRRAGTLMADHVTNPEKNPLRSEIFRMHFQDF